MASVLIAYLSGSGTTEKMAEYVAEGIRIAGHESDVRKVSHIRSEEDLAGYDAYVFGCPTYHLDMPQPFKSFLELSEKAGLAGKAGGAFSPRTHPSSGGSGAAGRVFEFMESTLGMRMTELGPFDVEADVIEAPTGMQACQEYGRSIAKML
jgi:flavodoxin